jgi:phenylpyruvate tautomerase PptA (4-oxalocrotonate tautomerase family)
LGSRSPFCPPPEKEAALVKWLTDLCLDVPNSPPGLMFVVIQEAEKGVNLVSAYFSIR